MKCFPFGLPLVYTAENSSYVRKKNIPVGHLTRNDFLGTHGVLCRYFPVLSSTAVLKDPLKIMPFHKIYK